MKENSLKRLYMLGFQLYDILEKAKLWKQNYQWPPGFTDGGGINRWRMKNV